MKKSALLLALALLLSACAPSGASGNTAPPEGTQTPLPSPQDAAEDDEVPGYDHYKAQAAQALGYDASAAPSFKTQQVETGVLTPGETATVLLFDLEHEEGTRRVLAIASGERFLCQAFDEYGWSLSVALADLDGDQCDELLLHRFMGGVGGAGSWQAAVYKPEEAQLRELFSYPTYDEEDALTFDTGFSLTRADGWQCTVENRHTGLSTTFTREQSDGTPFFDRNGIAWPPDEGNRLGIDPYFFLFTPVDVDEDGIFEVMTAQYTYFWGHSDGVGNAYTILRWNAARENMEVVNSGFWPYPPDGDNADEHWAGQEEFEATWYKATGK